jgi:hypothetical protein
VTSILRRRPSPALVISLIALFVSLGGVSYGVATGFIDSREIKNNDVRTRDLRNNDVRGLDIRSSTILGSDVAGNTLTGADIDESKLGKVPSATAAGKAATASTVGGITLRKFFAVPAPGSAATEVFRGDDFVLKAGCGTTGDPSLLLDGLRGVRPPNVTVYGASDGNPDDPEAQSDSALNPGDDLPLATGVRPDVGGTAIVSARNGRVATIHFGADAAGSRPFGERVCSLRGTVITG